MKITALRVRLFLFITIALVVPVLICCILLFSSTQNTLKENTSRNIQETLVANSQNIEAKLDVMDSASTSLQIALAKNPAVVDPTLNVTESQLFQVAQYPATVHSSLIEDTYSIGGFNHFYLYFPSRFLLLVSKMSTFDNVNSNVLDCHFLPPDKWGVSTPYENVICNPTVGKKITERNISKNFIMEDNEGNDIILTTNVEEQYINQLLTSGLHIKPSHAIIMDPHGDLVSSMDEREIGHSLPQYRTMLSVIDNNKESGYSEVTLNGKVHLLNWVYSPLNEWYYVVSTDASSVLEDIASIFTTMLIIGCCMLVLALGITAFLAGSVHKPLAQLSTAMTEIKHGNFDIKLPEKSSDEFSGVNQGFNEMADEISSLMNNISEEQTSKAMATIQMLQAEINPHMLYNSLESLYSIAKINQQDEIASLVMALSRFFRIALSGGKRSVPFREAFELANQYVTVQNIRLDYKISFTYDIPKHVYDLSVPKFLLQPVLENAILHGFQNRRGEWKIDISVREEGDWVIIVVRDNGIGIHETTLDMLNRRMRDFNFEDNTTSKGYALRNLNYQIKFKFGETSGIHLNSVYGEYTEAVIRLHVHTRPEKKKS